MVSEEKTGRIEVLCPPRWRGQEVIVIGGRPDREQFVACVVKRDERYVAEFPRVPAGNVYDVYHHSYHCEVSVWEHYTSQVDWEDEN